MELKQLLNRDIVCSCGRTHRCDIDLVDIGAGAIDRLPESAKDFKNILLVADSNTYAVCGERVLGLLGEKVKTICLFVTDELLGPDEAAIGAVREKMSPATDLILGIGSGVINDICKYVSFFAGIKCGIVATAPSMDGFASGTAPIIDGGFKYTMPARQPSVIIADTGILAASPAVLKAAGFGDIIGKFIALVDWRVAHLTVGEYYCENIASLVREALRRICSMADRVCADDSETAGAIMEILVFTGLAMKLAEASRPHRARGASHQSRASRYNARGRRGNDIFTDRHRRKARPRRHHLPPIYAR